MTASTSKLSPLAWVRLVAIPLLLVFLASSACAGRQGDEGGGVQQVIVLSSAWERTVSPDEFRERAERLSSAVDRLRAETGSGWIGRQDDVTGFLTELTGGRFTDEAAASPPDVTSRFLERYGSDLFGVPVTQVDLMTPKPVGEQREVLVGE